MTGETAITQALSRPGPEAFDRLVLSVVGLGKLGACTAACLAYRGFHTIGMDVNPALVAAINHGRAPLFEPRLEEVLRSGQDRIRATADYREVIDRSDVTFLIVPTPSNSDGQFSDQYLREALRGLAAALRESPKPYHLFSVTSTVSPGTTDRRLIPLIEELSGRQVNHGFGVCYNPEFIALGSVIRDFLNPDLVLIGESDRTAGDFIEAIHRRVCENEPQIVRMSLVSAEIAKLSLNAYVTMKISFANTLAQICEAIPGADVDAITRALGADRRVSPYGLRGALPYGGPCFPRDNRAFEAFAARHGVEARLARATDEVNVSYSERVARLVAGYLPATDPSVAVLGLAYKPNTPVIEESFGVALVDDLLRRRAAVTVYDRLAEPALRTRYGDRVRYAGSIREAMAAAAVTVVALPEPEFSAIDDSHIVRQPATIVDCWRILDRDRFRRPVTYVRVGTARE